MSIRTILASAANAVRVFCDTAKTFSKLINEAFNSSEEEVIVDALGQGALLFVAANAKLSLSRQELGKAWETLSETDPGSVVHCLPERHRDKVLIVPTWCMPGRLDTEAAMERLDKINSACRRRDWRGILNIYREDVTSPPSVMLAKNGEASEALDELAAALCDFASIHTIYNLLPQYSGWALLIAHIASCAKIGSHEHVRVVLEQYRPSHLWQRCFGVYDLLANMLAGPLNEELLASGNISSAIGRC